MTQRMHALFFAYPFLKAKGGAEKVLMSLANHGASKYCIFVLSEDTNKDWNNLEFNKKVKRLYVPYGSKNVLKIFFSLFFIMIYLVKYKPSIVHSHHRRITLIFTLIKLLPFFKFDLIHTSHNVFLYGRLFQFARCAMLTGVSQSVVKNLREFFKFKKEKIRLIYNGIEEYKGSIYSPVHTSAVIVGRLATQKGHIYLLEAWKNVIRELPNATLYIVGEGELKKNLMTLVSKFNLSKNVVFKGFRPNPSEWMLKTEFSILPSLWEGLPLTPLEAFSVYRTVVATAVDGTPEIVIDKKTGLLVPPKDTEKLAEAIIYLFQNPAYRKKMAEEGYKLFKERFTLDKMLEEYKELYQNVSHS